MKGGMRVDPKELPLRYQEQLGTAILAQLTQTPPVAAKKNRPLKARARILRFTSARAIDRYALLKDAVREGVIADLKPVEYDGRVIAFQYKVIWKGEFVPTGIPFSTLGTWRACQNEEIWERCPMSEKGVRHIL